MRRFGGLVLFGLVVLVVGARATMTAAQEKGPADAAPPGLDNKVDTLLKEWFERSSKITSLYSEFTRVTQDQTFRKVEKHEGQARYLAPNRARLDIKNEESYILTGTGEIWEYKVPIKQVTRYKLPPGQDARDGVEDGPLAFMFGAKPDRAKARYTFRILQETEEWRHIRIYPKWREDQANFAWTEVWLRRADFLPIKLAFLEPNGNLVTIDFKSIDTNLEINPTDFEGKMYKGWNFLEREVAKRENAAPPR